MKNGEKEQLGLMVKKEESIEIQHSDSIFEDASQIIKQANDTTYHAVNLSLLKRNWLLGKRIVEEELKETRIKNYGQEIIGELSKKLTKEFGKGFNRSNLYNYTQFYKLYPNIFHSVSRQSFLTWTHYRILIHVIGDKARTWYEQEAIKGSWSVRALQRNVDTNYYDRMLISHGSEAVKKEIETNVKQYQEKKLEFIKNPMILEFLGIQEDNSYNEKDIEKAIINHIQKFLLEMGKGYCFVGRQVRIRTEQEDYFIDLVFFNYILNCFVLIDIKRGKITHQDVGQMDMYVRMYDELVKEEYHGPTLGIVLCDETDINIAKYSFLNGNEQLFATKYKLCLPSEEELKNEIENQKLMFKLQHKK